MLTRLTFTHACGGIVQLVAGAWTTPGGKVISHCETCGEWLGSSFIRVEERMPPRISRRHRQRQLPGVRT